MSHIQELRKTVARLRLPGGCPWDIEQTHQSIRDLLVEECAELLDTIDRMDMPHMREELGDLLLHIYFHAQMAEEAGHFDIEDVAKEINEKLIRRHPHVFGDVKIEGSEALLNQWEAIKASEKKNGPQSTGLFKDLPPSLPALLYARDFYKQLRKKELCEEVPCESLTEERLGSELFALAAAAKEAGLDPESALRIHVSKLREAIEVQSV